MTPSERIARWLDLARRHGVADHAIAARDGAETLSLVPSAARASAEVADDVVASLAPHVTDRSRTFSIYPVDASEKVLRHALTVRIDAETAGALLARPGHLAPVAAEVSAVAMGYRGVVASYHDHGAQLRDHLDAMMRAQAELVQRTVDVLRGASEIYAHAHALSARAIDTADARANAAELAAQRAEARAENSAALVRELTAALDDAVRREAAGSRRVEAAIRGVAAVMGVKVPAAEAAPGEGDDA